MAGTSQAMRRQQQGLERRAEDLDRLQQMVLQAQQHRLERSESAWKAAAALAHSLSPYGVLARGYAIANCDGEVKAVEQLIPDQKITLRGARAEADCTVLSVREIQEQGSNKL